MRKILSLLTISLGFLTACSHAPSSNLTKKDDSHKGMTCIAPNVYVDAEMPQQQRKQLLQTVKQSRTEISQFFGGMKSSPNIYACSTKQCFSKFGGVQAKAKTINDDTVLLSSNGLDRTTLSHELAHAEFHKLLGTSHVWNKVPMWFDEGLALLACKDSNYSKPVTMMPLDNLASQDQWVNAVRSKVPAYSIAKQAVETWYKKVGTEGLQAMIRRLKKGETISLSDNSNSTIQTTQL